MDVASEREQLMQYLWSGDYHEAVAANSVANKQLVELFERQELQHSSDAEPTTSHGMAPLRKSWPRFEGLIALLFRARSQMMVPFFVAALSIRFLHYRVPRRCWDAVVYFTRSVMSRAWTEQFCETALELDPGARYTTASGLTAAVFDNFTLQCGYGSYYTMDSSGYRMDMTNWASVSLPASAVPGGLDVDAMLAAGGMFRRDRSLSEFVELFSFSSSDVAANQRSRWRQFLDAARGGTLLEKPTFASPYPPTHYHYHDPIFGRLQSSYEDVNFEVKQMRTSSFHKHSDAIMLGGDGLSYMRLIHRLAQHPKLFLMTKPVLIPQLGEHPHGTYHVMHGGWRLWWPLLEKFAAVVRNKQVRKDPPISEFNAHEHFLRTVTRACAEYVEEIAHTGSDYNQVQKFLGAANANLSFAYVCNFLYLFAFKYLQMRNAVRQNDSHTLDLVWRENLRTARTKTANKTNYSQMSVARIYWGWALVEPLQSFYHNLRTLRQIHTHTGWDWPIENFNLLISEGVESNITEEQLRKFIRRLNLTSVVNRGLDALVRELRNQAPEEATEKKIDTDVAEIKDFLRTSIGANYTVATSASEANSLNLDLSESGWGGSRHPRKGTPWAQMRRAMAETMESKWVEDQLDTLVPWHHWMP